MKKIELTGAVGDEIELVYGEDKLVVRLGEHRIIPDLADATIKAMKADANAFLTAAQLMYRGDAIGESNAKAKVASVVKKMFDAIPVAKPKEESKPAPKTEKKIVVEEPAPATTGGAEEEKKTATTTPKFEESPKKTTAPEKKSETTTSTAKKTSSATTKKTSSTTSSKRKNA